MSIFHHSFPRLLVPIVVVGFVAQTLAIGFDSTFATAGKFIATFSGTGEPTSIGTAVYLQPGGRIVVVGRHQQQGTDARRDGAIMVGLTPLGVLDTTFGDNGKVFNWDPATNRQLNDSAMLPDGSILALTFFFQPPSTVSPSLLKYTSNGQIDPSFNANLVTGTGSNPLPQLLTPGANGKIYVVLRGDSQFLLVRLNADGSRDMTFAPNGIRPLNTNRFPQLVIDDLLEVEGGKLLLLGTSYMPAEFASASFVFRLDSDGNIDRSFGVQGVSRLRGPRSDAQVEADKLLVQPDGKILIGGYYTFLGSYAILIRLTSRGRPDASFGSAGVALASFNNWNGIRGIAVAPDGKIVVTGHCGVKAVPPNERLFVARFSATGIQESSLVTNFITTRDASAYDVALQPDGKFVIAAFTVSQDTTARQLATARFLP